MQRSSWEQVTADQGWVRLGATWSGGKCPCPWQGARMRWSLRPLLTQTILWFLWFQGLTPSKMSQASRHQTGLLMLGVVGKGKLVPVNHGIDLNTRVHGNWDGWALRLDPPWRAAKTSAAKKADLGDVPTLRNTQTVPTTDTTAARTASTAICKWTQGRHRLFLAGMLPAEDGGRAQLICCPILLRSPATAPNPEQAGRRLLLEQIPHPNRLVPSMVTCARNTWSKCKPKNLNASVKVTDVLPNELPRHLPRMWPPLLQSAN